MQEYSHAFVTQLHHEALAETQATTKAAIAAIDRQTATIENAFRAKH
jgi:hypothetical protein